MIRLPHGRWRLATWPTTVRVKGGEVWTLGHHFQATTAGGEQISRKGIGSLLTLTSLGAGWWHMCQVRRHDMAIWWVDAKPELERQEALHAPADALRRFSEPNGSLWIDPGETPESAWGPWFPARGDSNRWATRILDAAREQLHAKPPKGIRRSELKQFWNRHQEALQKQLQESIFQAALEAG